jgi:hypothetical protein
MTEALKHIDGIASEGSSMMLSEAWFLFGIMLWRER